MAIDESREQKSVSGAASDGGDHSAHESLAKELNAPGLVPKEGGDKEEDKKSKSRKDRQHLEQEKKQLEEKIRDLEAKNKAFEEEISNLKDMYLRRQADFENSKKRLAREKEEAIKYANSKLILDLIPIIDDFERAIKNMHEAGENGALASGIELIEKQLVSMLEKNWNLKRIDALDQPFDPELHEAVAMEQSESYTTQVVIEEYVKGYMLNDRIIRHAKVKVGVPLPKTGGEQHE